ncbi:glycosyltransferase [Marinobacter adhaerens]|uniref:Glycosyltransferase n=1 Tax=Marinobacter adhaerens TaxID=1033846 RepID=A0A851HNG5_9GAMM|nr:glycosyltransferase [Marinobacter adhaerens]NWN90417.1 glycosyltransferase [Marinobacter adhaerens]
MDAEQRVIRILHLTFNMGFGGTEQVIRQLVTNLPAEGFNSLVMCIDGHVGEIGKQISEEGVPVHALSRGQGFDWELAKKIRQEIRNHEIDIVHCHQYTPWVYGWLAHIGTSAKVIFTEHGRFYPDRYRYKAMLINPVLVLFTPAIIAISTATKSALARYEFIPSRRIEVIYNGIEGITESRSDTESVRVKHGLPDTSLVFGTVSRLDPVKNQSMMIRAFQQCVSEHPECFLLIVGDGPERDALEQLVSELALENSVIFTGFISKPDAYLAAMDVFLLSSFTEGTSMTLLETMSLGIPAVATAVGGNPEVIDKDKTGVLVPNDDEKAFAKEMIRMVDDLSLRTEMGANARQRFNECYSASAMAENYLTLYYRISRA